MIKYKLYNNNISNSRDHNISNNIQFKCHISDGTNRIVGDLDRSTFKHNGQGFSS